MALESTAQKNGKIRVLHFAGIINRYDIIDSVLTRLDRSRFEVRALTGVPPRQTGAYTSNEYYLTRGLKRKTFLALEGFSNRTADRIAVPAHDIARLLTERQNVPREKIEV